ncbi:MAG: hypothetical protein ABSH41_21465 [Syntrophobacteraceae bacterium]
MRISRPMKFILVFVALAMVVSTCIRRSRFRIRVENPEAYPAFAAPIVQAGEKAVAYCEDGRHSRRG